LVIVDINYSLKSPKLYIVQMFSKETYTARRKKLAASLAGVIDVDSGEGIGVTNVLPFSALQTVVSEAGQGAPSRLCIDH